MLWGTQGAKGVERGASRTGPRPQGKERPILKWEWEGARKVRAGRTTHFIKKPEGS